MLALSGTSQLILGILGVDRGTIGLGEAAVVGELGRGKGGGGSRLKGTAEKELGGQEGGEVHVISGAGDHVGGILTGSRGIDGRDIGTTSVTVGKALDGEVIGVISGVRETSVVGAEVGELGNGRDQTRRILDARGI